uniref:Uncharacterized protein n=1 Tax=Arundo donax TaxID=35708 RepID=A0A0A9AM70_ARUDO
MTIRNASEANQDGPIIHVSNHNSEDLLTITERLAHLGNHRAHINAPQYTCIHILVPNEARRGRT